MFFSNTNLDDVAGRFLSNHHLVKSLVSVRKKVRDFIHLSKIVQVGERKGNGHTLKDVCLIIRGCLKLLTRVE